MPIANPNVGSFEGKSYLAAKLWFHLTLLLAAHWSGGGGGRMRDPWENIPEGEEMATDLAQMKYLEKKSWKNYFRVVEDVCGWAAAVSWISIFQD